MYKAPVRSRDPYAPRWAAGIAGLVALAGSSPSLADRWQPVERTPQFVVSLDLDSVGSEAGRVVAHVAATYAEDQAFGRQRYRSNGMWVWIDCPGRRWAVRHGELYSAPDLAS